MFTLTELDRTILEVVDTLQFGGGRVRIDDDSGIRLGGGVPESLVRAELHGLPCDPGKDADWSNALDRLTTLGLLESQWVDHAEWPRLEYRRPDRRVVATKVDRDSGLLEALLDGECVAIEYDGHGHPADGFGCYRITRDGLNALSDVAGTTLPPVRLTPTHELILRTLGEQTLTGEKVAEAAKRKYGSGHLKGALRQLVTLGLLENTGQGYRATPKGRAARPAE